MIRDELEQLAAVKKLHCKETRYVVDGWDDHSWGSMEELSEYYSEYYSEDDQPSKESIHTFDVCQECAHIEWMASDANYIGDLSAWPCATNRKMGMK